MYINDLLKIKLKKDILSLLEKKYEDNNFKFNKRLYKKLCKKKIDNKLLSIKFLSSKSDNCNIDDNKRCCARIWDNHYGSRCKYKKFEGDYCRHHLNMIKRNGKLLFNRYDEDKPLINDKNNRIPWISDPEIDVLNRLINKNWNILENQINIDLKKKRYFAPKI